MFIYIVVIIYLILFIASFYSFFYNKPNTGIPLVKEFNDKDVASNFLHVMETSKKVNF